MFGQSPINKRSNHSEPYLSSQAGRSITGDDTVATNIPTARNRLSAGGSNSLKVQSPWAHGRKALTKTITKIKSRYMPIGGSTTKATCLLPILYIVAHVFLIFFSIPYLFDLAYCEDRYGTPFSQASLIDREKVEPFGEEASSSSMDPALTERGPFSPSLSRFVLSSFFQARHCRLGTPIL
jgi:hypothetical protein